MPAVVCSLRITPSAYDIENMRNGDGTITRESVEDWLGSHTGDFQNIMDFYADIEAPEGNLVFEFASEDGELAYLDTIQEF